MSASAPTEPTHQTTVPGGYTAIYTAADLNNVRNDLSGKYILMNDIDMATFGNWDSIGDSSNKFTGTFDGNGYAIQNLTIDRADEDYVGLFEKTQSATIKNLGLENVDIKGNNNTGGLVGYGDGGNDIHNCYVTGNIIGSDDTGRLLGSAYGCSIANCYATGSIIGENDTGGLVGYSYKDTISNCYATGNVTGNGNIGGLMGYGNGGEVINCYTKSDVQQKDNSATSDFNILFGYMYKTTVYNVIGSSDNSTIQGTLSTGASILSEFSKNFKVLNNTEFNQASTWSDFRDDIWDKSSNVPKLKPNAPIQRIDEIEDFCINIYTIDDFDKIKTYRNFKFVLMNDIDVSSVNWAPIGDKQYKFYGTFDGNGYAIKNLKISRANESCLGLFGYTDSAIIKNLELENVNIKGDNSTGGLVGSGDNNEITNCHTSADVTSVSHSIGGIVGKGDYIKISNCYTTGKITGGSYTGGLIGLCQFSEILNSNVTGDVTGGSSTGGLFGYTSGIISDCYSSGDVTGADCTGGLAGTTYSAKFSNCYTNSNVKMKEGLTTPYPNIGVLFGLNRSYGAMITSANNVLGNIDKSTIKTDIGGGTLTSDSSNTRVMGQTEFLTSSTWNDYDDTIWDKSEYPPKLKNMPSNTSSDTDGTGSDNTGGGTGTGSGSGGDNTGGSTGTGSGSGSGSGGTGSDIPNIDTYQPKNTYSYGGSKSFRIQTGTGTDSATNAMSFDTGVDLSILEVDLSSIEACLESIHNIRATIDFVAQKTADIGIAQRRLETVSNVNTVKIENISATHTAVAGADTAQEVANYTKAQIMAQTAASLITQTRAFQANLLLRMISSLG